LRSEGQIPAFQEEPLLIGQAKMPSEYSLHSGIVHAESLGNGFELGALAATWGPLAKWI
jgi:hypothetical protein